MSRFATIFALCLLLAGCAKQGEGERCQLTSDCEDPLTCSANSHTCTIGSTTPTIDARPPTDAGVIDAPVADAAAADAP